MDALSWLMVVQVVISQCFVRGAISTGRLALYFWEELGWAILVAANAVASAGLYSSRDSLGDAAVLIHVNLLFGVVYLSWQVANLRLQIAASDSRETPDDRCRRVGRPRRLTWMAGYFATLLPMWANQIVVVFSW